MMFPRVSDDFWLRDRHGLSRVGGGRGMFLLVFFLALAVSSQCLAGPTRYDNSEYLIDNWQGSGSGNEELHENSAACIAQTTDGYLWVGTYGGLVRFNGTDFVFAGNATNAPRQSETIFRLLADRAGRLWVAGENRLLMLDKGNWSEVPRPDQGEFWVRSLVEDPSGTIWCGTLDGRLYAVRNGRLEIVTPPVALFPSGVFCCVDQKDGSLWLANRGYIGRLTSAGWQAVGPAQADRLPLLAAPAREGGLWVYYQSDHHLARYHADGTVENFPAPAINDMREMLEDHNGMVWIGSTLSGLTRLKPGTPDYNLNITITNGLANNVVIALTEDRENNLWVGTGSGGLHRLVARRFTTIGLAEGLPNPICRAVIEEAPGQMLVGTHGGGLARVRNGRVISVYTAHADFTGPSAFIWTTLRDHSGRIWLGTYNGGLLYWADGAEHAFTNLPPAVGKTVNALFEDSKQQIWVGTHIGLAVISASGVQSFLSGSNQPLNGVDVRNIAEDKKTGDIWFTTYNAGLYRIHDGQLTNFTEKDGVTKAHESSLVIDDDGCVWVGVFRHGLVVIKDGKIAHLDRNNGLPANTVGSLLDDGLGHYWLGTDSGVLRVRTDELRRILQNPDAQIHFDMFGLGDGLTSLECTESYQNSAARDSAGRLWFATQKGLAMVDPRNLQLNTNPPPVVIERVSYTDRDGRKNVVDDLGPSRMLIPAGSTEMNIEYAALSFTAPDKIRFAYRLLGGRHDLADTNQLRAEIFHTLAPGNYHFYIRAANNDGLWNDGEQKLSFYVQPFFWQTTWFWTLILAALAAAVGFGGWRLARVQLGHQLEKLKLQREQVRLAGVLEATSDLVIFTDDDRGILHLNPAGRRLLGWGAAEARPAAKLSDLFSLNEYQRLETEALPAAERAGTWGGETTIRNCAGREIPVSAVIIVDKDAAGKINFISAIARDISERKSAEERQAMLEEQLRQAQKMEAVGRLSGGVAHDFNNLLAVITGNISLIEMDTAMTARQTEFVNEIKQAAERAATLTRQLLTFSRRQALRPRNLDLNSVVENMGKMFRRILTEDIRMKLDFSGGPVVVHADEGMMEQVLLNLVVNARDAMPQGGSLEIAITSVELDAARAARMPGARAGEFAVLTVRDNGQGIPPEVLPRIFDPFFTTKDIGKGTGLGLATVYGIVQQHQGWAHVESQSGQGTTFRIYLPLLADAAVDEAGAAPAPAVRGGNETILVVEDEPAVRRLATRALTRLGYCTIEAGNGRQALELWDQHRAAIRLVLTDLVMPEGISGLELSRRLRAQAPDLKVLFMSGYNAEIAGLGIELVEGENFIAKPFNQSQLATIIRTGLDRK